MKRGREIWAGRWAWQTYPWHHLLSHVGIGIRPCVSMSDHLICTGSLDLSHHQNFHCGGDDDGARQAKCACRMHSCETGIATARAEDVGVGDVSR